MKTGNLSLILLCGLSVGFGPGLLPPDAQAADTQNQPVPIYTVPAPDPAPSTTAEPAQNNPAPTNGKADPAKIGELIKSMSVSPGLDEIVRLHKAGVEDTVILSYIQNSPIAYRPSAQEILQLREAGISPTVLTALLQHGTELRQRAAETAQSTATASPPAVPQPTPVQQVATYYTAPAAYPVAAPPVVYTYPAYSYSYYYPGYYGCYPRLGFYGGFYPSVSLGFRFGGGGFHGGFHTVHGGFHHH